MRNQNDLYETHPRFTLDLIEYLDDEIKSTDVIGEICNGKSAISNVLVEKGFMVHTNDLHEFATTQYDARYTELYKILTLARVSWIITNPPFLAEDCLDIVETSVKCGFKCAFLLPFNFMEPSIERENFLTNYPRSGELTLPRYSYKGNGKTSPLGTAWQIWNTKPLLNKTAYRI